MPKQSQSWPPEFPPKSHLPEFGDEHDTTWHFLSHGSPWHSLAFQSTHPAVPRTAPDSSQILRICSPFLPMTRPTKAMGTSTHSWTTWVYGLTLEICFFRTSTSSTYLILTKIKYLSGWVIVVHLGQSWGSSVLDMHAQRCPLCGQHLWAGLASTQLQ